MFYSLYFSSFSFGWLLNVFFFLFFPFSTRMHVRRFVWSWTVNGSARDLFTINIYSTNYHWFRSSSFILKIICVLFFQTLFFLRVWIKFTAESCWKEHVSEWRWTKKKINVEKSSLKIDCILKIDRCSEKNTINQPYLKWIQNKFHEPQCTCACNLPF